MNADVIIVGGGLSGCALAAALADGRRRIVVLEARAGKNPRFNGELIHPTGVDVLDELGLLEPLLAAGGARVHGFACVEQLGQPATLLEYREIPETRDFGFAIDHRDLVETIRRETERRPGVEVRLGERVVELVRDEERVVGVRTAAGLYHAPLVVACDGRHSKIRSLCGMEERARLLSFTAAVRLRDCHLPHPGYGHIFLGGWGPMLFYPINELPRGSAPGPERETPEHRVCIDLPAGIDRGTAALLARLRSDYLPHLPGPVRAALARALDEAEAKDELEIAANYSICTDECTVPGLALVGDACGCSHPLTATGMTIALHDVQLLARALDGTELQRRTAVNRALAVYQGRRYRFVRAREVLADALYEVFRGADEGTRAIRSGIFRYWNGDAAARHRSLALLSGAESRLPRFLREYLTVVGQGVWAVLEGAESATVPGGRTRSLFGLWQKSYEKLGIVARGVREGHLGFGT